MSFSLGLLKIDFSWCLHQQLCHSFFVVLFFYVYLFCCFFLSLYSIFVSHSLVFFFTLSVLLFEWIFFAFHNSRSFKNWLSTFGIEYERNFWKVIKHFAERTEEVFYFNYYYNTILFFFRIYSILHMLFIAEKLCSISLWNQNGI